MNFIAGFSVESFFFSFEDVFQYISHCHFYEGPQDKFFSGLRTRINMLVLGS